jgi:glucokinase
MNVFGIDIGGTKCAVSRLNPDGKVEEFARFATMSPAGTIERFAREIESNGKLDNPVFGISCGSPLDSTKGVILSPPNLPGWDEIHICEELTKRFGGRAFLMNDANACAVAEWKFGAGQGSRNMIFLTAGTGMGAGLIFDERLYEGSTFDAGEVGHIRLGSHGPVGYGKAGSFEGFCSGGGIARLALVKIDEEKITPPAWALPLAELSTKKIDQAAIAGDPFALRIMKEAGEHFGQALSTIIDILNPDRIVIGGIFPRSRERLWPSMQAVLKKETLRPSLDACTIVPAQLGETIGTYGAIAAALYKANIITVVTIK